MSDRGQGPAGFSWGEALNAALPIVGLTAGLYARPEAGQHIASFAQLMALNQEREQRRKEDQAAQQAIAQQLGQLGFTSDPAMSPATQLGFAGVQSQKQERERLAAERSTAQRAYTQIAGLRRPDRPLEEREQALQEYEQQYGLVPGLEPAFTRLRGQFEEERKRGAKARQFGEGFMRTEQVPVLPEPPREETSGVYFPLPVTLPAPTTAVREIPKEHRGGVERAQAYIRETGEAPTPEAQRISYGLPPEGIVGKEPTYHTKDFTDEAGNVTQITTKLNPVTGDMVEVGRVSLGKIGAGQKPPSAVMTPERIEEALKRRGLIPGTSEFDEAYMNTARQLVVPGLGVYGAGQMLPPILPPMPTTTRGQPGAAAPPASTQAQAPRSSGPLIPAPMMPEQSTNLVHRETLEAPPPGASLADPKVQRNYVAMPTQAINKLPGIKMFGSVLDSMESIIRRRTDLWPVLTGDAGKDAAAVSAARGKYFSLTSPWSPLYGTDQEVAMFESNRIGIPTASRAFTEVGNLAQQEQKINAEAIALGAGGRQASMARLNNIRNHVNAGLPGGLTFRLRPKFRAATAQEARQALEGSRGDKARARQIMESQGIDPDADVQGMK